MARTGIFGGTFNPVHNGHVIMALEFREQLLLDRLHLIPVAVPPHKNEDDLLPAPVRIELLEAALRGLEGIVVDPREVRRGGRSYSVETAQQMKEESPEDELYFLIGGDSVSNLPRWKAIERLAQLVTFVSFPRRDHSEAETDLGPLVPGLRVQDLQSDPVGISSTLVRERARQGLPLRGYVPESVDRILTQRGLLGEAPSGGT